MAESKLDVRHILASMPGPWGKALKALRERAHVGSRNAMAARVGMSPTTYGKLERGGHTRTSQLQRIADKMMVPIEDVLIEPSDRAGAEPTIRELQQRLDTQQRQIWSLTAAQDSRTQTTDRREAIDQFKRAAAQEERGGPKRKSVKSSKRKRG